MQIGMINHLQKWIVHFVKTHEWLDKFKQSGYLCLLTMTSHQKISHIRKFFNGMGRG